MKVASLFCGCGGMDLGLTKAGHEIVWANDIDQDSINTYKSYFVPQFNIDPKHIVCENIYNVDSNDIPECDVIVGGFPCQGFSIANTFRKNQRESELQNNNLYKQLLRVIKDKKPKYFIGENVKGILSLGGYESKYDKYKKEGRVVKIILNDMRNIGYRVKWKILNAAHFGVPQIRERVIFFGIRNDLEVVREFKYPEPTHSIENDLFLETTPSVWSAIKDLENIQLGSKFVHNHEASAHKVKINGYIGNRATIKNKPSPTIVGRGGGTGGPVIIPHPNNLRRLSVRELARIQSFPDDFIFYGSKSSAYRQIGNAVPWKLAYALGLELNKL